MFAHPSTLKAARIALEINQEDLAVAAGITLKKLQNLETNGRHATLGSAQAVQRTLESFGVVFLSETETDGAGYRLPRWLVEDLP